MDHFWPKFLFLLFIPMYLFGQSSTYSTTLDFNGSDSYITIPSGINDLSFSSDKFTLEAWIKIENAPPSGSSSGNNTAPNRDYIFSKKNDWSFYVLNINGSLYLEGRFRRDYHGNWPEVRSSTTISTDTWYHVAFTNSKSDGRIRIYINGNLDNSKNWTSGGYGLTSTTNPIGIGASVWNGIDNPSNFFDGEMSDIRFWDSERTQSAINYYKNSTLNTNSTLKLYYKLNEGSGSTINDLSGNSITGTARGSYQWKSNGQNGSILNSCIPNNGLVVHLDAANSNSYSGSGNTWHDISGNNNDFTLHGSPVFESNTNSGSIKFDENNDYAKSISNSLLSKTEYTKLAFFYPETSTRNIISGGDGSNNGRHAFWMASTSNSIKAGHNGSWSRVDHSESTMLNKWNFGAVSYSNENGWKLYYNGNQVDTDSNTSTFNGTAEVRIGAHNDGGNLFDGYIPVVLIYNRVLNQSEIQSIYNYYAPRYGMTQIATTGSCSSTLDTIKPSVVLSSSISSATTLSSLSQVSSVVTINANFSEAMAASPTISVKEIDYAKTIHIADYSSNQIGVLISNNRFDDLTRSSQSLVGKKIKVLSSGVTYTLTSLNSQSDSWVYFSTSPDFTPGNSSSNGNIDVVFIGDELVSNVPLNLSNSASNTWSYSWPVSSTLKYVSLTVSGTDQAGNSYSGSESITFTIDNVKPLLNTFTSSESDGVDNYIISSSNSITFSAVFSENMLNPRISIIKTSNQSEIVSSVMTQAGGGLSGWSFTWSPPSSLQTETVSISVSGTDIAGNPYDGQIENINRVQEFLIDVDNVNPTLGVISPTSFSTSTSTIILNFSEPISYSPSLTISGLVTNILMSPVTPTHFSSENISLSDYGYNMIALGSSNWSTIFGNNMSSTGLISYTIEIDGVDYLISGISSGNQNSSSYWWYFTTTPEYTHGYSLGGNKKIVFKAPNSSLHLRTWRADFNLSSLQSETFNYSIHFEDLAGNHVHKSLIGIIDRGSLFHYDFSNTNTHSGQTVNDLSGNNNNGTVRGGNNVYYDNSENAFRFNGSTSGDPGVAINGINYISGDSDKIENLTIQAKIKASSESGTSERIILSFDRSAVFRFAIGSDQTSIKTPAAGKLSFMFSNSDGDHDKYDSGFSGNLKDNQWHDVMIRFEANKQHGLKYYVDGVLTYSDPTSYKPIGDQIESQSPRYVLLGMGVK